MDWRPLTDKYLDLYSFTPLILCRTDEPYSFLGVWNPTKGVFCYLGDMFVNPENMEKKHSIQPTHWMPMPDSINYEKGHPDKTKNRTKQQEGKPT